LFERYRKEKGLQFDSRPAVLSLFGMMNWIYTWYNRDRMATLSDWRGTWEIFSFGHS